MENSVTRAEKMPSEANKSLPTQEENLSKNLSLKAIFWSFLHKRKWLLIIFGLLSFLYSMYKNGQVNTESVFSFHVPLPDMVKTNQALARQQKAAAKSQSSFIGAEKLKIDTIQVGSYHANYGSHPKTKTMDSTSKNVATATVPKVATIDITTKTNFAQNQSRIKKDNKREKKDSVFVKKEEDAFNTTVLSAAKITEKTISIQKTDFVKAAIYGNQLVRSGSTVRIRLLETLHWKGEDFAINAIGNGIALLNSNRVVIALTSLNNTAVKLIVYDKDFLPGIAFTGSNNVKENIRNNENQSLDRLTDNALYNVPYGSVLGAGADLAKGISRSIRYGAIQKKMGEIQLEEGYKVFLKTQQ